MLFVHVLVLLYSQIFYSHCAYCFIRVVHPFFCDTLFFQPFRRPTFEYNCCFSFWYPFDSLTLFLVAFSLSAKYHVSFTYSFFSLFFGMFSSADYTIAFLNLFYFGLNKQLEDFRSSSCHWFYIVRQLPWVFCWLLYNKFASLTGFSMSNSCLVSSWNQVLVIIGSFTLPHWINLSLTLFQVPRLNMLNFWRYDYFQNLEFTYTKIIIISCDLHWILSSSC